MITPPNNMPDLLLDIVPTVSPMRLGEEAGESENSSVLFGDLLLGLMATPQGQQIEPDQTVSSETEGDNILTTRTLLPVETLLKEMISLPDSLAASALDLDASMDKVIGADELPDNVFDELLLKIPSGKYEILDAAVKEGFVQLKVASSSDPDEVISVSIPLKNLQNEIAPKTIQAFSQEAIELGLQQNTGQSEPKLEALFEQLNLREIKITSNTELPSTETVLDPARPALAVQPLGQEIVIRNSLIKNGLKIQSEQPSMLPSVEKKNPESGDLEATNTGDTGIKTASPSPTKDISGKPILSNSVHQAPRKEFSFSHSQNDLPERPAQINELSFFETPGTGSETKAEETPMQTVRFTLPDNVKTTLTPHGQSVTLRIEPEHLGPARLNLVMHDDKLQARVVVENHQAKAAVEASLDKLVDQLSKANIEVERVEVMVESDTARNELLDRQSQWSHWSGQIGRLNMTETSAFDGEDDAEGLLLGYTPYVGAEGINLLA